MDSISWKGKAIFSSASLPLKWLAQSTGFFLLPFSVTVRLSLYHYSRTINYNKFACFRAKRQSVHWREKNGGKSSLVGVIKSLLFVAMMRNTDVSEPNDIDAIYTAVFFSLQPLLMSRLRFLKWLPIQHKMHFPNRNEIEWKLKAKQMKFIKCSFRFISLTQYSDSIIGSAWPQLFFFHSFHLALSLLSFHIHIRGIAVYGIALD